MTQTENALIFLEKFICKVVEKNNGRKKEIIKFYQCPKCFSENIPGGMLQKPINFIGHLLGRCKEWLDFVPDDKKNLFMGNQDTLNIILKDFMYKIQVEV